MSLHTTIVFGLLVLAFAGSTPAESPPWLSEGKPFQKLLKRMQYDPHAAAWTVTSGHYEVTTEVSAAFSARTAIFMTAFEKVLGGVIRDSFELRQAQFKIKVFAQRSRYKALHRDRWNITDDNSRGRYWPSDYTVYTYLDDKDRPLAFHEFYSNILLHEATHQFLHFTTGRTDLPRWFDEGLAALFQEWDLTLSKPENLERLKMSHYHRNTVDATFRTSSWVGLHDLLTISDHATWEVDNFGPKTMVHYAEAVNFMLFLLQSTEGKKFLDDAYRMVDDGSYSVSHIDETSIKKLERGWNDFIATLPPIK